jgi:hypothetical protein
MAKFVRELPIYANAILPHQSRQKDDYPELDKNETAAFPEGKGQLLVLADTKGNTVVFNKKCLTLPDEDTSKALPYCNILDKYHDSLRTVRQVPLVAASSSSSTKPKYNEEISKFDKYDDDELEDEKENSGSGVITNPKYPRKARYLDGSVSLDKLIVGDHEEYSLPNVESESTLFFNEYEFDLPNIYIGSPAPNIKSCGVNTGAGRPYGIQTFLHQVDTSTPVKDSTINLGFPKKGDLTIEDGYSGEDIIRDQKGLLNLMDNEEVIRMRIYNLNGGVEVQEWDDVLDVQEVVDKYTYKSDDYPFDIKDGDEFKNWYGLRNTCGGTELGSLLSPTDDPEREKQIREEAKAFIIACGFEGKVDNEFDSCKDSFRNPFFGVSPEEPEYFDGFEICQTLKDLVTFDDCLRLKLARSETNGRDNPQDRLDTFHRGINTKSATHKTYYQLHFEGHVNDCCVPIVRQKTYGGGSSACGFLSTPADVCGCGYNQKGEETDDYESECKFGIPLNIIKDSNGVSRDKDSDFFNLL